jgi:hypothetical protein
MTTRTTKRATKRTIRVIKSTQVEPEVEPTETPEPRKSKLDIVRAKFAKRTALLIQSLSTMRTWGVGADTARDEIGLQLQQVHNELRSLPEGWKPPRKGKDALSIGSRVWVRSKYLADYADALDVNQTLVLASIGKRLVQVVQGEKRLMLPAVHLTAKEPQ